MPQDSFLFMGSPVETGLDESSKARQHRNQVSYYFLFFTYYGKRIADTGQAEKRFSAQEMARLTFRSIRFSFHPDGRFEWIGVYKATIIFCKLSFFRGHA